MPYQINKCKATLMYKGRSLNLEGLDSVSITRNETSTVVYPKDGTGSGIKQVTGKDQADSFVFTATYLTESVSKILQTIFNDPVEKCTITVVDLEKNASKGNNRYVLDYATVTTDTYQTEIDDTVASKYTISFNGKIVKAESSTN